MKRHLLLIAVVLLATFTLARPSEAITVQQGEILVSFNDDSSLFYLEGDDESGVARQPRRLTGQLPTVGDENRAIFEAQEIENVSTGKVLWQRSATEELTGVFYDLELTAVPGGGLTSDLLFEPLGRNAVPGIPQNYGGVIEIYADSGAGMTPYDEDPNGTGNPLLRRWDQQVSPNVAPSSATPPISLLPNAAPLAWQEGEDAGGIRDQFPTVTDGQLWLQAVFVPASVTGEAGLPGTTVLSETVNLDNGSGGGGGWAMITGGSAASLFTRNFYGPTMDLSIGFSTHTPKVLLHDNGTPNDPTDDYQYLADAFQYDGLGSWQVNSSGTASASVIPEPATFGLLGLALIGVGGAVFFRRHQRG